MQFTNSEQLYELFLCGGLGFLLGAYYDVFRVARLILHPSKGVIFVQDVFFFFSSGAVAFLFSLTVTGGAPRLYLFIGLLTGFAAYYFTIGRVVIRCAETAAAIILQLWHWLWAGIFFPFRLIFRLLKRPLEFFGRIGRKTGEKIGTFFHKRRDFLKNHLKLPRRLLYNQHGKS